MRAHGGVTPDQRKGRHPVFPQFRAIAVELNVRYAQCAIHHDLGHNRNAVRRHDGCAISGRDEVNTTGSIGGSERVEPEVEAHIGTGCEGLVNLHSNDIRAGREAGRTDAEVEEELSIVGCVRGQRSPGDGAGRNIVSENF